MGQSKRYKGKTCAYCGVPGISTTNDHVVARAFFLKEDQQDLPQVSACQPCNHSKSRLEHYVSTALMIGSNHVDADRFRQEHVKARLDRNQRLRDELGIDDPPQWVLVNGILQRMHMVKIDPQKVKQLIEMIVGGLHMHHYGEPLDRDWRADATMFHPDEEANLWNSMAPYFPPETPRVGKDLGRGSFMYLGVRSPAHAGFSAWQVSWHGGIQLYGQNSPPAGIRRWWVITRPTPGAVKRAEERSG